jgi:REP element-mobilizing transposase RayT
MRKPREFYKGGFYHVFNRGVNKQAVFREKEDYIFYLYRTKESLKKFPTAIHAYSLLMNHYHFLPEQTTETPLNKFFQSLNTSLAIFLNKKYGRVGHIFQGRFQAKPVEKNDYLLDLSFYINLNPILEELQHRDFAQISASELDKLLNKAENYPWSSYGVYLGLREDGITSDKFILSIISDDIKKARKEYRKLARKMLISRRFLKVRDLIFEERSDSGLTQV